MGITGLRAAHTSEQMPGRHQINLQVDEQPQRLDHTRRRKEKAAWSRRKKSWERKEKNDELYVLRALIHDGGQGLRPERSSAAYQRYQRSFKQPPMTRRPHSALSDHETVLDIPFENVTEAMLRSE